MIKFEITESPDIEVTTTFEYFHNQVYIGKKSGNLTINDPALLPSHLLIETIEKDILIQPLKDVEYYLINGKRATNPRKVKAGDLIKFGNTTLKIISFEESPKPSKKTILNRKLEDLIETNSHRLPVIETLSKLSK